MEQAGTHIFQWIMVATFYSTQQINSQWEAPSDLEIDVSIQDPKLIPHMKPKKLVTIVMAQEETTTLRKNNWFLFLWLYYRNTCGGFYPA